MESKKYPSIIFKERIKSIKKELKHFCKQTIDLYVMSSNLIENYDENIAKEVKSMSKQLDIYGYEIEKSCIRFIAVEQPVATDLMYIESSIRVISHIKRIAHLCDNISVSAKEIQNVEISSTLYDDLRYMADYVQIMLTSGVESFYNQDIIIAKELPDDDDKVDDLFDKILEQITELISQKTDYAVAIVNILFIARYLERIADRVVNIGDRVIFINTHKRPSIENLKKEEEENL